LQTPYSYGKVAIFQAIIFTYGGIFSWQVNAKFAVKAGFPAIR
jgi:hypothetical protein